MRGFKSVFVRELRGYFSTPLAYVIIVIFLGVNAWYVFYSQRFFELRQADLSIFFRFLPWMLVFFAPAIGMRLWSEERRSGTVELLFTLPVTVPQAVLGKFLAAWVVILLTLLLTAPQVWTVFYLGEPDAGPIICGYVGAALLSACYLAIGGFFSAVTRNQVIAFVLGVVGCGLFVVVGNPSVMDFLSGQLHLPMSLVRVFEDLSFQTRYESLGRGVAQARDIVFFAVFCLGWLAANMVVLQERKAA